MLATFFSSRGGRWLGRLVLACLLLLAALGGVITGLIMAMVDEADPIEELEDYSPSQISRVIDRTGENTVAEFSVERREIVPLDRISPLLISAFIAIEDERFLTHVGVSPRDIASAVASRVLRGGRLRGASTLTMQLARKTLPEITDERSFQRKGREGLAALQIESRYSKDQILEFYLNQIPMGNGIYGVQAAARSYFGVDASDVTAAQAATIAGIAQIPEKFNPRDALANAATGRRFFDYGTDDATVRRDFVLRNMRRLGMLTEGEYMRARSTPMELGTAPDRSNRAPYFVDMVRRQILENPSLGSRALFHEGTLIQSTVDLELQSLAQEVLSEGLRDVERLWQERKILRRWEEEEPEEMGWRPDPLERRLVEIAEITPTGLILQFNGYVGDAPLPAHLPYFEPENILQPGNLIDVEILETNPNHQTFRARILDRSHVQGALVALDVHTGEILALVGGENWFDEENAGQWNRAILGGRQPGSCFKPFVFAAALESGFTPGTVIMDEEIRYPTEPGRPPYIPRNFENAYFGPTTLLEGLAHSRNVLTVRLTEILGVRNVIDRAQRFDYAEPTPQWRVPRSLNLGLGIHDTKPLELACAIAAFANEGVVNRPIAWTEIRDSEGRLMRRNRPTPRVATSREVARMVLDMMEEVIASGSGFDTVGSELIGEPGIPAIAGKTGTTTGTVDAWFEGLTPDWAVVVFVGFDNNISLGPGMTGSRVAGPMWREFIRRAVEIRPPTRMDFPDSPNLVRVDICSETGLLWSSACESARQANPVEVTHFRDVPFIKGTQPLQPCPHVGLTIAGNGG
jgi:penicillin-binding protein 1A